MAPTARHFPFTDKAIDRIKPPHPVRVDPRDPHSEWKSVQVLYTDSAADPKGLSLVVGSGGSKTYRSQFRLFGKWQTRKLGKHGDFVEGKKGPQRISVGWAREQVRLDKLDAEQDRDPRERSKRVEAGTKTFADVVKEYLASVKPKQRSYSDTERALTNYCKPLAWKPLAAITKGNIDSVLHGFANQGKTRTAQVTLTKLRALWKWAQKRGYVTEPFVVNQCEAPHSFKKRHKVYSDAELRTVWQAADKLSEVERDYTRLLMLTVSRRKALANMQRRHLSEDVSMWTVPFELTKSKGTSHERVYRVPLPPLTRTILLRRLEAIDKARAKAVAEGKASLDHDKGQDYIFGTVPGVPYWPGAKLKRRLVKEGAPRSFIGHSLRHTCSTWFENEGHSPWERGLLLNHAETGVTSSHYSFGFAKDLKLALLTKWEEHLVDVVRGKTTAPRQEDPDLVDYKQREIEGAYADLLPRPEPEQRATHRIKGLVPVARGKAAKPTAPRPRVKPVLEAAE